MKVKILLVEGHGDASKEVVWLQVIEDCDIGKYLLADSTYTADGKISNKLRHFYWFPDKSVKRNDFVALHTKIGTDSSNGPNQQNGITHHFYWNLRVPVWNDDGDVAVLIEANDWEFKKAKK